MRGSLPEIPTTFEDTVKFEKKTDSTKRNGSWIKSIIGNYRPEEKQKYKSHELCSTEDGLNIWWLLIDL